MKKPKEYPIIFNGPMVRAILDGRKTQTRRHLASLSDPYNCPYGMPGDRLWIKETWRVAAWRCDEKKVACDYKASPEEIRTPWIFLQHETYCDVKKRQLDALHCRGIKPDDNGVFRWDYGKAPLPWRPSIHMPYWASRITLEITGVRVERLQDISDNDALEEGISESIYYDAAEHALIGGATLEGHSVERCAFAGLWDSINGKRPGCSWQDNPWVWVIEFKKVQP